MRVKKKAFHKVKNISRNIRKVYYESKRKAFHKVKERVIIYYLTAKPFINDYTIYREFIFLYILLFNRVSHCKAIYSYQRKNILRYIKTKHLMR